MKDGCALRRAVRAGGARNEAGSIAQNVANLGTAGYRADEVKFDAVMSKTAADSVAFASAADTTNPKGGPLTRTDNQLDVAVQGDGWFHIATPAGTVYTRDGRSSCWRPAI